MRSALADKVDYFEADLTAFTTIRALREAVGRRMHTTGNADSSTDTPRLSTYHQEGCDPLTPWLGNCQDTLSDQQVEEIHSGGITVIPASNLSSPSPAPTNASQNAGITGIPASNLSSPSPAPTNASQNASQDSSSAAPEEGQLIHLQHQQCPRRCCHASQDVLLARPVLQALHKHTWKVVHIRICSAGLGSRHNLQSCSL